MSYLLSSMCLSFSLILDILGLVTYLSKKKIYIYIYIYIYFRFGDFVGIQSSMLIHQLLDLLILFYSFLKKIMSH
jgi:hypothetical protein